MKSLTETGRTKSSDECRVTSDKQSLLRFVLLLVTCNLSLVTVTQGATKVFLHDTASKIVGSSDCVYRLADATQGAAKVTAVTSSISGAVSGQYWPSATTGHIITKTAGGTKTIWLSAPLASGVTISGTITPNLWGLESANQCNCGARYEVLRWSVAAGGIVSSLGISTDGGVTEWGTSAAVRTAPTLTPTSTAFSVGDRIALVIYNDDGNGVTEGQNRNWTLDYDAGTGVDGDTYLSFTETLSFSADTNNARPVPMLSNREPTPALSQNNLHHRDTETQGKEELRWSSVFLSLDKLGTVSEVGPCLGGENQVAGLLRPPLVFARGPELIEGLLGRWAECLRRFSLEQCSASHRGTRWGTTNLKFQISDTPG
jgi:hypothetical protein